MAAPFFLTLNFSIAFCKGNCDILCQNNLLINITKQVEWFDCSVAAMQRSLEERPEIFQAVCMDAALNVAFQMVYDFVRIILYQSVV